ncbi:subtilase family protein [Blastococcus colisei]|uniref:Subtilase family protein n=1 Tax=Blastococcus colisei TaxID=1564162 RepID=A0A543PF71_9ACTN|nr:S8 family serine peptidase [Blastococcus colisei]TQN42723.1 subtilase family protein [Blastococcus colisei]
MIDPRFSAVSGFPVDGCVGAVFQPETTGRQIVVFADGDDDSGVDWGRVGISEVADSRDFASGGLPSETVHDAQATVFGRLGMAVVSADPTQVSMLQSAEAPGRRVLSVSPELVHHVLQDVLEYTRAYRDGVDDLAERVLRAHEGNGHPAPTAGSLAAPLFADTPQATWGIQAVQADSSPCSGRGIGVAVLDTGFDLEHPDFAGRSVTAQSFVPGEQAQDGHGHGTHCIGSSCGPRSPSTGPRYGVAYEADIFVGKVLSDAGSGTDGGILAGIDWAVTNGCPVISMSLGADVMQEHPPYSVAGARALEQGSLIIAAAGNNADRRIGRWGFVGAPANSPEIMAVGALDQQLDMAYFSARSLPARGGQVDIAGPGWQVYSSWPMPMRYRAISGTSMATPHVAGVAALWAEATGRRGRELWATLCQESQRLMQPSVDAGSGLCVAPQ